MASRHSTRTVTLIPNPGLRNLYELLSRLRVADGPTPGVRALGIQLALPDGVSQRDSIAVRRGGDHPSTPAPGYMCVDGSFEKGPEYDRATVLALRNLAADPGRRFRRYGQEESLCPFCQRHLGYGTLASGLGYCSECAGHIGWPHDERAAQIAEDVLRRDIFCEIADERTRKNTRDTGEV